MGYPSDVYALGLLLLECLTGQVEFPGSPVESAVARLHRQPVIPAELGTEWAVLLGSMTAREPERRPTADEAELLRNLGGAGGGTATLAVGPPPAAMTPTGDRGRRLDTAAHTTAQRRRRSIRYRRSKAVVCAPVGRRGRRGRRGGAHRGRVEPPHVHINTRRPPQRRLTPVSRGIWCRGRHLGGWSYLLRHRVLRIRFRVTRLGRRAFSIRAVSIRDGLTQITRFECSHRRSGTGQRPTSRTSCRHRTVVGGPANG